MGFVRRVEALVGQNPRVGANGSQVQLVEPVDDDISSCLGQPRVLAAAVDRDDQPKAAGSGRRHAGDGVLHDDTVRRIQLEAAGRLQEGVRRRFAG